MSIEIKDLSKKYFASKSKSLDSVNAVIPKGIFGLLGENGAGKTSLMKTLATILAVDEGDILLNGVSIKTNSDVMRLKLGYLPQRLDFFEKLTVYEMLEYIAILKNIDKENIDNEIRERVENVNLSEKINSKIKNLSGGMKQRVAIAQALIGNPDIIILDEPTVGLDPNERLSFRNMITDIGDKSTIIMSTHIISDIAIMCNNVGIMKKGRMIYCGSIEDLLLSVEGKFYVDTVAINESIDKKKYKNISSITRLHNQVEIRFFSEDLLDKKYKLATPTLEDAYFYWMSNIKEDI